MYGYGFSNTFKTIGGGVVPFDTDAQAFITAASITDPTQQSAVNQLVVDLKAASIWTKMKAVYPFVGGSASSHKWNLKDARDLDSAYRLSFSGGITHASTGVLFNGTNAYAVPFLNILSVCSNTSHSFGIYSRTNSTSGTQVYGSYDSSVPSYLHHNVSGGNFISGDISTLNTYTAAPTTKLINCSRTANNSFKVYRDGSVLNTNTSISAVTIPNGGFVFGARFIVNSVSFDFFDAHEAAFAYISDGLSDSDVSSLNNAVNTFQTTLSRNV